MKRVLPLAATLLLLASFARADFVRTDTTIGWEQDGDIIWQFSFDPDAGKPFFHPLRVPGGPSLTKLRPDDHVWHYGLWFSWKYINEANYWEQSRETGRSEGRTVWGTPHIRTFPDGGAEITLDLDYVHPTGRVDLTETRFIIVSAVATDGSYTIDWSSTFTAGREGAYLDRTPLPDEPNGVLWGGYAGLGMRLGHGPDPVQMVNLQGPMTDWVDNRIRPRTGALGVTVYPNIPDSGSLAVLAGDANMPGDGDDPWYCINGQPSRFWCSAVLVPKPLQLAPGEVWPLRYRLQMRKQAWTTADLSEAVEAWEN
ncbi:DUF6807 family protein [Synoicihabitans lomoniglobus]|uniref:PmoA family protein n=1 Tax=Synoicihabitans lomoniglobus TaxID=2909285 RepID=A0AAF0CNF6_9BACT|nr:PmoA family protein [Opitutaceae bacterium LMO-M01]WED64370.1 PmoA family protein [Opitutaceae bacterium LMO-M01]